MEGLKDRKILLGVTGSIAAYKSASLIRLLVKSGAEVKVIMTPGTSDFIGALTLATLSKNPVLTRMVAEDETGQWNNHVELGLWADLFLVAPITANTIAKMAHGIADNLLLTAYLSAKCQVMIAPAMDLDMYSHASTQKNLTDLKIQGVHVIQPDHGELASGLIGEGRMAEPDHIVDLLNLHFLTCESLIGKTVLVTSGPTFERIDPVRFIGNFSSGKMGHAIADALAKRGAKVELVSGPTSIQPNHPSIVLTQVESASEMHKACLAIFKRADAAIMAAAIADYRPVSIADQKIKKSASDLKLDLEKTTDILFDLGQKKKNQKLIGFALETENGIENAKIKLKKKQADVIVLNTLESESSGFGTDTNKVWMVEGHRITEHELMLKTEVAEIVANKLSELLEVAPNN